MRAAAHPYVVASAALTAASLVAVTPIAPRVAEFPVVSKAARLIAGEESLLNVPINLFYDVANIPYYELEAVDFSARSLFNSGPWFVVSPTNLWGVDPGDPSHFMSVVNYLFPNPVLSGMNSSELDFSAGLGQQLWGLMAAELPTSAGCDAMSCFPVVPESPVTGVSPVDFFLWLPEILKRNSAQSELFPMFANWFTVGPNQLSPYDFTTSLGGSYDPSGTAYDIPGIGFPGTVGPDNLMPWTGSSYTFEPWVPIQNFFNSLMAAPATNGFAGTGLYLPDLTEIGRDFQALAAAALVAFDPLTPGSPFCPQQCTFITDAGLNYPQLVQDINNAWPGNTAIEGWLNAYANGTANVPSAEQIQQSIQLLQNEPFFDFKNPSPPVDANPYAGYAQFFHDLWTSLGFSVPALNPDTYSIPTPPAAAAAAVDPSLSTDLSTLTATLSASSPTDFLNTLDGDLTSMLAPLDALLPADTVGSLSAASGIDPGLSTDLSTITTALTASLPADFFSTLDADLTSMLASLDTDLTSMLTSLDALVPADMAAQLPADFLSLF